MIDWSSTFDIVFAAVTVALVLFFLLSTIIVSVKGKRACNAFDVVLRILASLALIASAVMLVCAVFTKLDGDYRIYAGPLVSNTAAEHEFIARLYFGGTVIDLPFPLLFCFLSTTVGSNIIAILFIDSLVALIVDCLVANKKSDKQADKKADKKASKNQPKKSPEQLKREAELERIRRIGEQAVRKTNEAARTASQDEKTDAPTATDTEQPAGEQEQEPAADWRTQEPEQQTGFVGIKDNADDFDTFDDFDAEPDTAEQPEQTDDFEQPTETDEFTDAEQTEADEQTEAETDEFAGGDEFAGDPLGTEEADESDVYDAQEEQPIYDDQQGVDEFAEEEQQFTDEEGEQPLYDEQAYDEQPIETEENIGEGYEPVYDGSEADNYLYEQPETEQVDEQPTEDDFGGFETEEQSTEQVDEQSTEQPETIEPPIEEQPVIEPDRDIYIPEMRTIVKQETEQSAQEQAPVQKPRAKRSAPSKPRSARPAAKRMVEQVSDDKKLPVTRRYVILDRRNAVNMFGEYLKERNQAEKDKLKSSINTIIIE